MHNYKRSDIIALLIGNSVVDPALLFEKYAG